MAGELDDWLLGTAAWSGATRFSVLEGVASRQRYCPGVPSAFARFPRIGGDPSARSGHLSEVKAGLGSYPNTIRR